MPRTLAEDRRGLWLAAVLAVAALDGFHGELVTDEAGNVTGVQLTIPIEDQHLMTTRGGQHSVRVGSNRRPK